MLLKHVVKLNIVFITATHSENLWGSEKKLTTIEITL